MTAHPLPSSYLRIATLPFDAEPQRDGPVIGLIDEVANAIRGPAVQLAIEMRIEAIMRFGHGAEHDAMLPIGELPTVARKYLVEAAERIGGSEEKRSLPAARKSLARAAALCMAAMDRLDAAIAAEAKQRELGL